MATTTGAAAPNSHHGDHHQQSKVDRKTHGFRAAFLAPLLFFIGSICWVVGAAVHTYNPRTSGLIIGIFDNKFDAASSLFLIGSAFFWFSAIVRLISAFAEAALVRVGTRTPGLARIHILAAWLELMGASCLVVGSALYLSNHDDLTSSRRTSAGVILWLIGSGIYTIAFLLHTVVALIVAAVTALMPEMLHRQRAWFGIASTIFKMIGWVVFFIGAAAFTVLLPPGFVLFGSLLWIGAATLWILGSLIRMFGTWYSHVPIMSFATAAAAVSSIVAGTAAQPGLTTGVHSAPAATKADHVPHSAVPVDNTTTGAAPASSATMVPNTVVTTAT